MHKLQQLLLLSLLTPVLANAATPTLEQLYETIKQQQSEIDALKASSNEQDEKINSTADAIEQTIRASSNTSIGGYAELHYNNLNDQGPQEADKKQLDLHRFVAFIGHEFNQKTRFFSEFEIEHNVAGEGKKGEVEVEQAYVEHDLTPDQHAKVGVFLVPVGIINETHEPDTFYGVERNPVETNIIPATWWEGGFAFNGELGAGFSYDVAVTSGFYLSPGKYKVRDGRQKVSEANANDLATTLRVKYTGIKGLEIGLATQHQEDVTQGDIHRGISAVLVETHVAYQIAGFGLRALYANWNIQDDINAIKDGAAKQTGYYVEPSYRINEQWGVFVRASQWDNLADGVSNTGFTQVDTGVNFWIHPQVALKLDYQDQEAESRTEKELDGVNLGVGLSF